MKCDMTKGSIRKNILFFSLPVFAGSMLQQLYNMADSILVGQFLGVNALAAVGATGSIFFGDRMFGWFFQGTFYLYIQVCRNG